jgi:hypothetical protein
MHPTTAAMFNSVGLKGVSDNTTIGELTAKAHQLTKGGTRRRNRRKKKSCKKSRWSWLFK